MELLNEKTNVVISKRLKQLRKEKGLSHESLHNELEKAGIDVSAQSLKNYEVDHPHHTKFNTILGMRLELLYNLAQFYGVSVEWILGITDNRTTDIKVKEICEYTGLSEHAVNELNKAQMKYKKSPLDNPVSGINKLFQFPDIFRLGQNIQLLVFSMSENYRLHNGLKLSIEYHEWRLSKSFEALIKKIIEKGKTELKQSSYDN